MSLTGRTVVISGATGELGSTMARACATAGANLLLLSNNGTKGKELLDSLALPPERVIMKVVDLLDIRCDRARSLWKGQEHSEKSISFYMSWVVGLGASHLLRQLRTIWLL